MQPGSVVLRSNGGFIFGFTFCVLVLQQVHSCSEVENLPSGTNWFVLHSETFPRCINDSQSILNVTLNRNIKNFSKIRINITADSDPIKPREITASTSKNSTITIEWELKEKSPCTNSFDKSIDSKNCSFELEVKSVFNCFNCTLSINFGSNQSAWKQCVEEIAFDIRHTKLPSTVSSITFNTVEATNIPVNSTLQPQNHEPLKTSKVGLIYAVIGVTIFLVFVLLILIVIIVRKRRKLRRSAPLINQQAIILHEEPTYTDIVKSQRGKKESTYVDSRFKEPLYADVSTARHYSHRHESNKKEVIYCEVDVANMPTGRPPKPSAMEETVYSKIINV